MSNHTLRRPAAAAKAKAETGAATDHTGSVEPEAMDGGSKPNAVMLSPIAESPKRSEDDEKFHEAAHADAVKSAERRQSLKDEAEATANTLANSLEENLRQQALAEAEAATQKWEQGS